MLDLQKRRVRLALFVGGLIALSITDICQRFSVSWCTPESAADLLASWHGLKFGKLKSIFWRMAILAIWWAIWTERNDRCFNDNSSSATSVGSRAKKMVIEWATNVRDLINFDFSFLAEKCRELVGEEASSQSGKFTFLNCFDMGSGSLACVVKEGVKLYSYNIRAAHVEKVRHKAIEVALTEALLEGLSASAAAKQAQKVGAKAAKLASRQTKRIIGPIISSGWDFFEAIYYGGTMTEGFLRGTGTLLGTYAGGFQGEQRLGRVGYLVGSHLGSWVGGRIGLMVYDVINGVHYLLQFVQTVENVVENVVSGETSEGYEAAYESSEASEDSYEVSYSDGE